MFLLKHKICWDTGWGWLFLKPWLPYATDPDRCKGKRHFEHSLKTYLKFAQLVLKIKAESSGTHVSDYDQKKATWDMSVISPVIGPECDIDIRQKYICLFCHL